MSSGKDSVLSPPAGGPLWSDRWVTGAFLPFLSGLSVTAAFLLLRDGKGWVLLIALAAGALLWALEHLETRYLGGSARAWNPLPGYLAPVIVISLAVFVVCLPTLNSYFSGDEFAYIPLFRTLSLSQFLRLFHTDLSQGVLGWNPRELRPLYGLSYKLSYSLWGLHPLGYHLSGVLVHVINSAMVFIIAKKLAPGESWRAGFAGLLFAVQPVHSWTISWANGSLTEAIPSLFYISAFLCFACFRRTGLTRYLVMSIVAFAACLLSKETAVTLPIVLISFDLFRKVVGENKASTGAGQAGSRQWLRFILTYFPFAVLLLVYLGLRRLAFVSYLREDQWGSNIQEATSSSAGFWLHLTHLGIRFGDLQVFNLRHLLLPFPAAVLGLVLGLYLVWVLSLLRRRSEYRRSMEVILYFGLVWYLITNLPLLVVYQDPHHLYLPAVGPCIATAFLVAPARAELRKHGGYLRLLGAALLVGFSACQLWKEDTQWARKAEVSARGTAQLAAALGDMPKQTLVVVWFPRESSATEFWDENLPYSLQEPFSPTDLYSRAHIIELPDIYCCPLPQWWEKTKPMLGAELAGAPDEQIEIHLFAWDKRSSCFQTKTRVLPRELLRAYITKSLGGPLETVNSLGEAEANKLVEALARLVSEGP